MRIKRQPFLGHRQRGLQASAMDKDEGKRPAEERLVRIERDGLPCRGLSAG